ncbi:hypothetical protein ACS0TY_031313 [Phlomoides rotata]
MVKHTCDPAFRVKNVKSRWLSEKFMRKFVVELNRKVNVFRKDAMDEIGCDISKDQAYMAKKITMKKLEGNPDLKYSKLWEYAEELRFTNPSSTVILRTKEDDMWAQQFNRFYVCLDAVKKGFKASCMPIIGVDGCHERATQPYLLGCCEQRI